VLSFAPGLRVFVSIEPIDMRGSFDAIAGHARRLGLEPTDGNLYFFLNRRRQLCKIDAGVETVRAKQIRLDRPMPG